MGVAVEQIVGRLRNAWRKSRRAPFYTDLRIIAPEHRHLYRDRFRSAINPGAVIGLLRLAWDRKHLRTQRRAYLLSNPTALRN